MSQRGKKGGGGGKKDLAPMEEALAKTLKAKRPVITGTHREYIIAHFYIAIVQTV